MALKINGRNHTTNMLRVNDYKAPALYFMLVRVGFKQDFTRY